MKYSNKIILILITLLVVLFSIIIFLVKIPRYENCSIISNVNHYKLLVNHDTYSRLSNRRQVILKNEEIKIELDINEEWVYDYETKIWGVSFDTTSNLINGNYLIFVKNELIFEIRN
ncbi:MAG: hypothetical protein ACRC42_04960 [Mycoplasma sp.]